MVALSPLAGAGWQFFGNNGLPLAGGKLYTYAAGTTTPLAAYTSISGATPHTNPIVMDSAGRVPSEIWLTTSAAYKFVLKTSADVEIWTKDNISGIADAADLAAFVTYTDLASTATGEGAQLVGFKQTGTGAVASTVDAKLKESVSVKDFGATGDGTSDDTAYIQAALNYAAPRGYTVYFPPGTYRTTATVGFTRTDTQRFGVRIVGSGTIFTTILADHNSGPVLALNRSNALVQDITLSASAARTAGAAGSTNPNCGLLMEAPDTASAAVSLMSIIRTRVISQPSHGIVHVGLMIESYYEQALCQNNLGHGFVFDGGQMTARSNQIYPGLVTLSNCWAIDNTGHGLKIGDPVDASAALPVRFLMLNFECAGNAETAGVRLSADEAWVRGYNITFDTCAMGTLTAAVTGCIRFAGENLQVRNQRAVNTTHTLRLEQDHVLTTTYGIRVDGLRVLNKAQNPAIIVSNLVNVRDINVSTYGVADNITKMFTTGAVRAFWNLVEPVASAVTTTTQSVNNTTTLVDATELAVYLRRFDNVFFEAVIRHSGNSTANIKLAFNAPGSSTIKWDNTQSIYVDATGAVTVSSAEVNKNVSRAFGANADVRTITIRGWVEMTSTSGPLQLRFAQNTATAVDTSILPGSTLRVLRANTNE